MVHIKMWLFGWKSMVSPFLTSQNTYNPALTLALAGLDFFLWIAKYKILYFSSAEPVCDNSEDDKYLPFPLPSSSIIIVDSPESLNSFISDGLKVQFILVNFKCYYYIYNLYAAGCVHCRSWRRVETLIWRKTSWACPSSNQYTRQSFLARHCCVERKADRLAYEETRDIFFLWPLNLKAW